MLHLKIFTEQNMSCIYKSKTRSGHDLLPNLFIEKKHVLHLQLDTQEWPLLHLKIVSEQHVL